MVKAHTPWPCPQHVAWPSPYTNCSCTLPEPGLHGHSAYLNPSTCFCPAVGAFSGFIALKTEQTNEVQGILQYPHSEPSSKETHTGRAMQLQNANPATLEKKLLIFDHSGNSTRLFYSPFLPLVQSPVVTTTQFAQAYVVKEEKAIDMGQNQKHLPKNSLMEDSDKDHIVNAESEMHEDTEEINALLYSDDSDFDDDDDDDEVTSTVHSPLVNKRTCVMQEQFEDLKEEVASSDWPNKRQKFVNEACEYDSDAESKCSSGQMYSAELTKDDDNSMTGGNIQLRKDNIWESLRALENIVPGAKGKHPLLVINGTIEYLRSLMTETGTLEANNIPKG